MALPQHHQGHITATGTTVIEECNPGVVDPHEVLVSPDGHYLGSFDSEYEVPFGRGYPTGWTNGTWYEQPGAISSDCDGTQVAGPGAGDEICTADPDCFCDDCHGLHDYIYVRQRAPDDPICPCNANTSALGAFDYWNYAINPQRYTGGEGCNGGFDSTLMCYFGGPSPARGRCEYDSDVQPYLIDYACWPLGPFALANPSSRIRVVDDTSGPVEDPCVQEEPTLEIDFAGNGAEGATFLGQGGGYDAGRYSSFTGCGDSSANNGWSQSERSATGWTVTPWHIYGPDATPDPPDGSAWRVTFWVKAVPDNDGFTCSGYSWMFRSGFWPFRYAEITIEGEKTITLTDEWQFYDCCWRAETAAALSPSFPEPITNVPLALMTLSTSDLLDQFRPFYRRRGRVHVKHVSVTPCFFTGGVNIKKRIYGQEV